MKEEWKPVDGYDGRYEVSNLGNFRRVEYIKPIVKKHGYAVVSLHKNGRVKTKTMHRLVAETFIPRIDGKTQVNHKDEDKTNNRVDNLEWVTAEENCNYGTRTIRATAKNGSKTPILQCDLETGKIIAEFKSQTVASMATGVSIPCINACLKERQKSAGGYLWKYKHLDIVNMK